VLIPLATARYWVDGRPRLRPFALLAYGAMVLCDVVVANLHVARIILFLPAAKIQSAWISVPIDLPSPEARALLAGTITMTPGTLTADFARDGKSLLIHALHAPDPEAVKADIKRRYEARLQRIFA
jgi:multicomponent K+:H+ antiporter subunit E